MGRGDVDKVKRLRLACQISEHIGLDDAGVGLETSAGKKESKKKQKSDVVIEEPKITVPSKPPVAKKELQLDLESLPKDKDSLYQQLIAFEGRRYSLEKAYKDLTKSYSNGKIDEFEFNNQSENLREILNEVSTQITEIRRIISSL